MAETENITMSTCRWCRFVGFGGASWTDGEGRSHVGYPPKELEHNFWSGAVSAEEIREITGHEPASKRRIPPAFQYLIGGVVALVLLAVVIVTISAVVG